jgi:hypothetical protein
MISLRNFLNSVRSSFLAKHREEIAEAGRIAEKRRQQDAVDAAWAAEQRRREDAAADSDGSREAERIARQERQEEERLAFIAAQIVRQTAKSSGR